MNQINPNEWAEAHYKSLYNYALYKIEDKELIDDLIQDTFLDALEGVENFEHRSTEITWLTAILKYKIYKIYRQRSRKKIVYVDYQDLIEIVPVRNEDERRSISRFNDPVVYKEFEKDMKIFLGTLPEKWQQLYFLKYIHDETSPQICEKLKVSESNYWVMTHRLKLCLREWYLKHWN